MVHELVASSEQRDFDVGLLCNISFIHTLYSEWDVGARSHAHAQVNQTVTRTP